jgi:hypothetical protein
MSNPPASLGLTRQPALPPRANFLCLILLTLYFSLPGSATSSRVGSHCLAHLLFLTWGNRGPGKWRHQSGLHDRRHWSPRNCVLPPCRNPARVPGLSVGLRVSRGSGILSLADRRLTFREDWPGTFLRPGTPGLGGTSGAPLSAGDPRYPACPLHAQLGSASDTHAPPASTCLPPCGDLAFGSD